ncbi:hypothetical protein [Streptomyces sp. NBC_01092]|uniref:hypothetical protein n=1 Tax=Streptomyces sp. NBC_01092 TaxID=2903748 RepID=UPI003863162D|nr:hypothetical protein OG254_23295 [Streptomyces sp. NBC_01092]
MLLEDGPIRRKSEDIRKANSSGRAKRELTDAAAAGKAYSGWESGPASDDCVRAWQMRLRELGDLVEDAAEGLNKAMDREISTDHSIADEMRRAANRMEGGA